MADYYGTAKATPTGMGRPTPDLQHKLSYLAYYRERAYGFPSREWCEEAGCPRAQCVACQRADGDDAA
jgi:hypothetical protein